jgi:hypothetical protein
MKKNLILLIRKLLNKFYMCNCKELTIPVGPTGPQGLIGPQGEQGEQGPIGTCSCVTLKISSLELDEGGLARINTTITGGTAPYTYLWEWADNINSGFDGATPWFIFTSPTITANSVVIDRSLYTEAFDAIATSNAGTFGLIKCTVTDSNGDSASDTYLFITMVAG